MDLFQGLWAWVGTFYAYYGVIGLFCELKFGHIFKWHILFLKPESLQVSYQKEIEVQSHINIVWNNATFIFY